MKIASEIVAQEHPMGCAVACVASRCRITYDKALSTFSVPKHAWTRGFYCEEIIEALARLGHNYSFGRYLASMHERFLDVEGTIAFVDRCELYPDGHFFVRTAEGWMNPWSTFPHMNPVTAGIQQELPGDISYIVFEI